MYYLYSSGLLGNETTLCFPNLIPDMSRVKMVVATRGARGKDCYQPMKLIASGFVGKKVGFCILKMRLVRILGHPLT